MVTPRSSARASDAQQSRTPLFQRLWENRIARFSGSLTIVNVLLLVGACVAIHMFITNIRDHRSEGSLSDKVVLQQQYTRLMNDLRQTATAREQLSQFSVTQERLPAFVQQLESIASETGVQQTIDSVPAEEQVPASAYAVPVIEYRITLHGALDRVTSYVALLNALPELIRVESIKITSPDTHADLSQQSVAILTIAVAFHGGTS